jgi:hypothetical protein
MAGPPNELCTCRTRIWLSLAFTPRLVMASAVAVTLWSISWMSAASADGAGGSDGGNTISVGASSSASTGSTGASSGDGHEGVPGVSCALVALTPDVYATFDLQPGGPTPGSWFFLQCSNAPSATGVLQWVPAPTAGPTAPAAGVIERSERAAAVRAETSIVLPNPIIELNPPEFSIVNIPTWLSLNPVAWRTFTATATAGSVSARATATPVLVTWSMGDGRTVACKGPGQAFVAEGSANLPSSNCTYSYTKSSLGEPSPDGLPNDAAFTITATITWAVSWNAVGVQGGGSLPSLQTQSSIQRRVEQVESVVTG